MYTIALHNLEFFAFHGVYDEEHLSGNRFRVDVMVEIEDRTYKTEQLESTVDYEKLFGIIRKNMGETRRLLETVIEQIHLDILKLYPQVLSIDVKIAKMNPPISGMNGISSVQLKKNYHVSL